MTKHQNLIKRLDDLTRKQIKLRDGFCCQYSDKSIADGYTVIDWAHIITRGSGSLLLRWHSANSLCLTRKWHTFFDAHPDTKMEWFKWKFPARYKLITELDRLPVKTIRTNELEELLALKKLEMKEAQ